MLVHKYNFKHLERPCCGLSLEALQVRAPLWLLAVEAVAPWQNRLWSCYQISPHRKHFINSCRGVSFLLCAAGKFAHNKVPPPDIDLLTWMTWQQQNEDVAQVAWLQLLGFLLVPHSWCLRSAML